VRVATFNIHCCVGTDAILDLVRVAEVIRESEADFLALQELDRGRARTGGVDQPAAIAELTGLDVRFWPTVERSGGAYGVAIAVRGDLEAEPHRLPRLVREEPRLAVVARWAGLSIVAAHVAVQRAPARPVHLRALASLASELAARGGPVVLMGDLNSHRHQLGPLIAAGLAPGPQHTTFGPAGRQLDYVMTGPGVEVARSWTIASPASDHLCLVAELDIE
jgi:endonuclease/exonuclease/phosphatase family metal-dependent hydrolase